MVQINSPGHFLQGREGRVLNLYSIYNLCEDDINFTEPLSPGACEIVGTSGGGEKKFPLVLKLLGTNSTLKTGLTMDGYRNCVPNLLFLDGILGCLNLE